MMFKYSVSFYLSTFFIVSIVNVESWRPFRIKLFDPLYTIQSPNDMDFNFTIDEHEMLSVYVNPLRYFHNSFLHIEYIFESENGKYDMVYVNKTFNLCQFLNNRKLDIILRVIFKIGEQFGELPRRCPIPKKLYYLKNMKVDSEYFPPVMPEKSGKVVFANVVKEHGKMKTIMNATLYFKIENLFKSQRGTNS